MLWEGHRLASGRKAKKGAFMVRKFISATVAAALCSMSATPVLAQEYRFNGFDAPRGATATLNLRVPMDRQFADRSSYGLTLSYGQTVAPGLDGRTSSRAVNFADFRFTGNQLRQARVASFDLANLDRDRRLNLAGGGGPSLLLVGAIVGAGAVICFVVTDCFGDDDEDDDDNNN